MRRLLAQRTLVKRERSARKSIPAATPATDFGSSTQDCALKDRVGKAGIEMITALAAIATLSIVALLGWAITARQMGRAAVVESRKFATLLEAAPEVIVGVDQEGIIRFANAHIKELLDYSPVEVVGASVELLIPQRLGQSHVVARQKYAERPERRPMGAGASLVARRRDGSEVPVEISLSRIELPRTPLVLCIVRDVTEQTRARRTLEETNHKLQAALAATTRQARELRQMRRLSELLQCCTSESEVYEVLCTAMSRLLPGTSGGIYLLNASATLVNLMRAWGTAPADAESAFAPLDCWGLRRSRLHRTHAGSASTRCAHVSSSEGVCVPMSSHGQTLGVLCVLGQLRGGGTVPRYLLKVVAEQGAITLASLRLRDALRVQSIRDPLTGLFNRRFLDESLERELSGSLRTGAPLALLMLDLDHFKRFNDSLGHQCGDRALREVALLLKERVRGSDIVCRFGGEELVVVLPSTTAPQAAHLAEEIRMAIEKLLIRHNGEMMGGLTVSIGVSACPEHARSPDDLLRAADAALYAAKRAGRNRVVVATSSEDTPRSRIAASSGDC